jgi:hypothetical protein
MSSNRGRRGLLAALVASTLSIVPVSVALACSCAMTTPADSFDFADVVFSGTVTAVEAPAPGEVVSSADPVHYAFAVDGYYKGDAADAAIVAGTALDSASCGTSFAIDERWLVFGTVQDGTLWTGLCSGNVLLTDAETERAVVAEIGAPKTPPDLSSSPADAAPIDVPVPLVVALGAMLAVIGVSAWAFRRPARRPFS